MEKKVDAKYFALEEAKRKLLAKQVWIPLRSWKRNRAGVYGELGYIEDLAAVRSVAIFAEFRKQGEDISWSDTLDGNGSYLAKDFYVPSDIYQFRTGEDAGLHLCLTQNCGGLEEEQWYLHQDIEIAFGLIREGDTWLCPQEDYEVAAKFERDATTGKPDALLIKASYLQEYLFLRKSALRITSYFSRTAVVDEVDGVGWEETFTNSEAGGRFEGRQWFIHPGGHPYGSRTAVFHMSRTDVIDDEDVPELGPETADNVVGTSWHTGAPEGDRLLLVEGEFWRDEWFESGAKSTIVSYSPAPSSTSFFTDNIGGKETADSLNNEDIGKWLWFRPNLVQDLLSRRGSNIKWHTRDTFTIQQGGYHMHFGVNQSNLLTVYAYDIARLREWQRLICQGHNVQPDGKVSGELLAAQVQAKPASTQAPEKMLKAGLERLGQFFLEREKRMLFIEHTSFEEIALSIHRFRSTDKASLLSLAKDLARIFIDRLDKQSIQKGCKEAIPEKTGSLKSFQAYLENFLEKDEARKLIGPMFGVYELRLADAHLPSAKYVDFYNLAGVDPSENFCSQGYSLLKTFLDTIWHMGNLIGGIEANV